VLRQDITDCMIQDIFVKLSDETEDRCTSSLPGNVLTISNKFPFGEKAVTQTYAGTAVIAYRCEGLHVSMFFIKC
jgi:hypothetical protein